MENVSKVYLTDFVPSIYTSPCTMYYIQNGKEKKWNIFAERNGVVIILYNKTRDVLILVKQFRAAVYLHRIPEHHRKGHIDVHKYPPQLGVTLEWCAGLEDKEISTEEVAQQEILEECGYSVEINQLEKIGTIKNLSVTTGARSTFYYCEVTDDMIDNEGGGEDGENVEVIEMPLKDVIKYASNKDYVSSPINFMYGLYWFLYNKYNKSK